jgi:hypothetical protein
MLARNVREAYVSNRRTGIMLAIDLWEPYIGSSRTGTVC